MTKMRCSRVRALTYGVSEFFSFEFDCLHKHIALSSEVAKFLADEGTIFILESTARLYTALLLSTTIFFASEFVFELIGLADTLERPHRTRYF